MSYFYTYYLYAHWIKSVKIMRYFFDTLRYFLDFVSFGWVYEAPTSYIFQGVNSLSLLLENLFGLGVILHKTGIVE